MVNDKNQKSAHTDIPEELLSLKNWVNRYSNQIITVLLVVAIVVTSLWMIQTRQQRRQIVAGQELAAARSVPDFESLLEQYENTEVAPLALLSLAKLHFDTGNYEAALARYDQFLEEWDGHEMSPTAVLGRMFCIEARGDESSVIEAEAGFETFAEANPDHYLYPQARMGQARCKEQLGQLDEARIIYEDFLAAYPDNPWTLQVQEQLAMLERRMKRQQS